MADSPTVNHAYMAGQKACTDPIYPGSVASHSSNIYCSTKEYAIKRDKVEGDTQGLLDRIKNGETRQRIVDEKGIGMRTLERWINNETQMRKEAESSPASRKRIMTLMTDSPRRRCLGSRTSDIYMANTLIWRQMS